VKPSGWSSRSRAGDGVWGPEEAPGWGSTAHREGRLRGRQATLIWIVVLAFGTSAPFTRLAAAPAETVVVWRVLLAWPILAIAALQRRDAWPREGILAGLFLGVHWLLWIMSVQRTTVAASATLVSTGALWAAALARPLLGEQVSRRVWIGIVVALIGVALLASETQAGRHSLAGDGLALLASLAYVGYAFLGRRARTRAAFFGYTAVVYGVAGLLCLSVALVRGAPLVGFSMQTWLAFALLALFPTLIGHGGINYLLRHIEAATLSMWTLGEAVLATLLAWPMFGEVPGSWTLVGGCVTLLGVAIGSRAPARMAPPGA
jgi:drug/metabolite transporter (DMT)-like permease